MTEFTLFALFLVAVVFAVRWFGDRQDRRNAASISSDAEKVIRTNVGFYRGLTRQQQRAFMHRIDEFLSRVEIVGVDVEVEEVDCLLIAAGAIIPIFAFPDWKYNNISQVLLYEDAFNSEYQTRGDDRNIVGMVGEGPMQRTMILSRPAVRSSFRSEEEGRNTVIHEFVHLIDKADGATDGVPEYLLARPHIIPWIKLMHETIEGMLTSRDPDINIYGATSDAEFFAVVAEYFFEKPDQLQANHPQLFAMLEEMFRMENIRES